MAGTEMRCEPHLRSRQGFGSCSVRSATVFMSVLGSCYVATTMLLSLSKRCTTNSLRCSIHAGVSQQVVTSHKTDLGSFLRHFTGEHSTSDRFSGLALESANARKLQYVYPRPLLERHISKSPNHKPRGHTLSGLGFSASEMLLCKHMCKGQLSIWRST